MEDFYIELRIHTIPWAHVKTYNNNNKPKLYITYSLFEILY
jgi:hypothetical protein